MSHGNWRNWARSREVRAGWMTSGIARWCRALEVGTEMSTLEEIADYPSAAEPQPKDFTQRRRGAEAQRAETDSLSDFHNPSCSAPQRLCVRFLRSNSARDAREFN